MTEVVRVKRLIRKLGLIKKSLLRHLYDDKGIGDAIQSYYTLQECLFKEFGIAEVRRQSEEGVLVSMTSGKEYYFDYDELYTPSTWADYDEEDEPLDEEF